MLIQRIRIHVVQFSKEHGNFVYMSGFNNISRGYLEALLVFCHQNQPGSGVGMAPVFVRFGVPVNVLKRFHHHVVNPAQYPVVLHIVQLLLYQTSEGFHYLVGDLSLKYQGDILNAQMGISLVDVIYKTLGLSGKSHNSINI